MYQTQIVKNKINELLDKGFTDKQKIYSAVSETLHVARPTVRRAARELRLEMGRKISILQSEVVDGTTA